MKVRSLMILLALCYSLFHFSPLTAKAEENKVFHLVKENNEESSEVIRKQEGFEQENKKEIFVEDDEMEKEVYEDENKPEKEQIETSDPEPEATEDQDEKTELDNQENESKEFLEEIEKNEESKDEFKSESSKKNAEEIEIQDKNKDILKNGMKDERVIELKSNLSNLGFPVSGNGTNFFGDKTEQQVKEFQAYYDLNVTGIVDDKTLDKMEELLSSPLQEGIRDKATVQLKKDLAALGFAVPGSGTTLYGSETAKKVGAFQSQYGLTVSGIADELTLAKIQELLEAPLSNGMYREEVKDLKRNLGKLGFSVPGKGTTLFGPNTEKKVKEFQTYYGLETTGTANEVTLAKIEEILASPLQKGKRHQDTVQLKRDLAALGFSVPGNGTTLYGKETAKKVRAFQSHYGINISGIADEVTLAKIQELLEAPLSKGMHREDVKTLKNNLDKLGFPVPGKGTTLFGPNTEKKVKEFQKYYGLEVTGIADDKTLDKMEELLSSPLQEGKRDKATVQLKKDLAALGFAVPGNGTTLYGKETAKKVRAFQSHYGLTESGIADEITLAKIQELLEAPLSNGVYREDVKTLKSNLDRLGFPVPGKGTTLFGPNTEKKVKEFQKYYGLEVTGIADDKTLEKMEELLSSPLQKGNRDKATVQLKKDLAVLGFAVPGRGTNFYGKETAKKVREFQSYYNLNVNGIADDITLAKINSILSSPLQNGKRHQNTVQLKKDLAKLGFPVSGNGTTLFGGKTEQKVKEFQAYYGLKVNGIADNPTLKKIEDVLSSPLQNGKRHKDTVKLKEKLAIIGYSVPGNGTTLYGKKTEQKVKQFQKDNGLKVNGIADDITLQLIDKAVEKASKNPIKIFLDPGHGGKDPGAQGYGLQEKNVVLDIALKTADFLTSRYLGVEIKLSRTTDEFIALEERARMANNWGADYFVSIHNNSFNGSANGFESYIYNGNVSKETKEKQEQIHQDLIKELGVRDRGMKEANFSVLRNTSMPAILLEYLFIDNVVENGLLKNKSYRNKLGEFTANAIAKAFGLKKK